MKVIHMRSRLPKRWQILRIFPAMFPKLWTGLVDFVQEQKTALDGMAEDIGAISDIGEHNLSASEQAAAASHEMMRRHRLCRISRDGLILDRRRAPNKWRNQYAEKDSAGFIGRSDDSIFGRLRQTH